MARQTTTPEHEASIATMSEDGVFALARANIYNLLASVFAESPSERTVQRLNDGTITEALRQAGLHEMAAGLGSLVQSAQAGGLLEAIQVEYARLFVVPGPGYTPPYQSLYCGQEVETSGSRSLAGKGRRQLWGDAAVAAGTMYREAGLSVMGDLRDVPDHIGLELQFMHHLCSRQAEALNNCLPAAVEELVALQTKFLEDHLLPWVSKFARAVAGATCHPFYRAMASLAAGFVYSDADEMGVLSLSFTFD